MTQMNYQDMSHFGALWSREAVRIWGYASRRGYYIETCLENPLCHSPISIHVRARETR
jgi:hypothetical protein